MRAVEIHAKGMTKDDIEVMCVRGHYTVWIRLQDLDKPAKKTEDRFDPSNTEAKHLDEKQKLLKPPGLPLAAVATLSGISL